ncbi:uroporphyrin-III C-methyltransferase/precorrin-2 dehydrogenase/sirohydrochlorin ferrochelatase [Natronospira proteinivora]|uniref:Siroheme synthase n=1 Tax=Natronospira proteinivora TaxID=1807133 RepID=A0ABT1GA59_9GAMM|nr:siroheme synthase CysG [Natronospira proteinivora]MCP1727795.1 uroporphyrin-III C-methyltransferase/precorrin-2 dehydrogenase/sirohydrochlorin ferrochelatase [Natronospira proteinivora]
MDYLPIFVATDKRPVLVVGGGTVAERKIRLLLRTGAQVRVVSPEICDGLKQLEQKGRIEWIQRAFENQDLEEAWLVYAATDDPFLQKRVAREAEARRVLVNTVDDRDNCSFIMPAIVDRSPVMVAISTGGTSPVLARRLRDTMERLLPQATARLAEFVGEVRDHITRAIPEFSRRRRFHEWLVDGPVARFIRAGQEDEARQRFEAALKEDGLFGEGHVYLVGAGPGDPELLTLKALQTLQAADVIVHDGLVDERVLDLARRDAEFIDVAKKAGHHRLSQARINQLLAERAEAGEVVVRLKGGDPFVFGRGGEEITYLRERGIAYEVVPGITAAVGCAAYAGLPLTHRDHAHSVWLVTAHCRESVDTLDWNDLAHSRQTLAFYMGVRQIGRVQSQLTAHGRHPDTPVAFVENGCRPEQRVIVGRLGSMSELAERHQLQSPALIYVGEVARLAGELNWYGQAPIVAETSAEQLQQAVV